MYLDKKKKTPERTCSHSYVWAFFCWLLIISTSALSFRGLNFHRPLLAGLCARSLTCSGGFAGELTQSTHTGYIPTKAWQRAGRATPRLRSLPGNQKTRACSITHDPSVTPGSHSASTKPLLSFLFTKTRKKTKKKNRSRSQICCFNQTTIKTKVVNLNSPQHFWHKWI